MATTSKNRITLAKLFNRLSYYICCTAATSLSEDEYECSDEIKATANMTIGELQDLLDAFYDSTEAIGGIDSARKQTKKKRTTSKKTAIGTNIETDI